MIKKCFTASLNSLHDILLFINEICQKKGFDYSTTNKIMLAVEEAVVNVIHHGYKDKQGPIEIACEEAESHPGLRISIKDQGIPFNPMDKAVKIKKAGKNPLEDESIGGWGIFLYVEIMDRVEYRRNGESNLLLLTKFLSKSLNKQDVV